MSRPRQVNANKSVTDALKKVMLSHLKRAPPRTGVSSHANALARQLRQ
jgi:hypothetical protein